jgi:nitrogen fixation protein FixH
VNENEVKDEDTIKLRSMTGYFLIIAFGMIIAICLALAEYASRSWSIVLR